MSTAALALAALAAGCSFIAPFDPNDQPERPAADAGWDIDRDADADADADSGEPCMPECGSSPCGPDGCGGLCDDTCGDGEVCAACRPGDGCAAAFECAAPEPGRWVLIPPGGFDMGSPGGELGRDDDEASHRVTLTHGFVIASAEMTQSAFIDLATGRNPSHFVDGSTGFDEAVLPAEMISWMDAVAVCNTLSDVAGLEPCYECDAGACAPSPAFATPYECDGYRLPTEAEWEYAARAGTTTATPAGDLEAGDLGCPAGSVLDGIGWHCGNAEARTHPVGTRAPNGWGLFDMLGNVSEWCHDLYAPETGEAQTDPAGPSSGSLRAVRGGAFEDEAEELRSASRRGLPPAQRTYVGLRPVRTVTLPVTF